MKPLFYAILFITLSNTAVVCQNTVGLLSYDEAKNVEGYNLYFPNNQHNVYLLDNCGRIVHTWEDSVYFPGNAVYLTEDGHLYKCGSRGPASNGFIHAGGAGEVLEKRDWDNNLLWRYTYNDSTVRMHHDIEVLPNGNVLILAWERRARGNAIVNGRDTALIDLSLIHI